jgi:hypothetical protein
VTRAARVSAAPAGPGFVSKYSEYTPASPPAPLRKPPRRKVSARVSLLTPTRERPRPIRLSPVQNQTARNRARSCRLSPVPCNPQLQAIPYSLFPIPCSLFPVPCIPPATAPNASAALIPPNPKLLETMRRTGISSPSPVT